MLTVKTPEETAALIQNAFPSGISGKEEIPIDLALGRVLAAPVRGDIWARRYPLGDAAAHPLGYYHCKYGITAVERVEDPLLSGYLPESDEPPLSKRILTPRAKEGKEVELNLDARLQLFAYDQFQGRPGAAVVMNPRDGSLLALVSSPGFDPRHPQSAFTNTVTY